MRTKNVNYHSKNVRESPKKEEKALDDMMPDLSIKELFFLMKAKKELQSEIK